MVDTAGTPEQETPADFGDDDAAMAARWISEITLAEKSQAKWLERCRQIIRKYEQQRDAGGGTNFLDAGELADRFALLWSNMETLEPAVWDRAPTPVVGRRWKDPDPVGRVASEVLERALTFCVETADFSGTMKEVSKDYLLLARGVPWVRYVPQMQTMTPDYGAGAQSGTPAPADSATAPSGDGTPQAATAAQALLGMSAPDPLTQAMTTALNKADQADNKPDGTGREIASDGQLGEGDAPYDVIAWETAVPDHVSYNEFLHNVARKWQDVYFVGRKTYQTRDELKARFTKESATPGKTIGEIIPLDHTEDDTTAERDSDQFKKATIYELWDKPSRTVIWISKGYSQGTLDVKPDPLELQDFFPCPKPAIGTRSPDTLLPQADYLYYQGQAEQINRLTARIGKLMEALQLKGFYASGSGLKDQLSDLFGSPTTTMIPVESWAAFKDGGINNLVIWLPIDVVAAALTSCISARKQLLDDVYQITGMADIMRGDVDPDETATATRTKATWGSSRVRNKQQELARVAGETLQIMGQVIASKFQVETLTKMTNIKLIPSEAARAQLNQQMQAYFQTQQMQQQAQMQQRPPQQPGQPPAASPPAIQPPPMAMLKQMLAAVGVSFSRPTMQDVVSLVQGPCWDEVMELLRDNTLRTFRIDVEADSTIAVDDEAEKEKAVEFVETIGKLVGSLMPLIQLAPELLPMAEQTVLYLVRRYRVGREMEEVIEKAFTSLSSQAQQAMQSGQPRGQPPAKAGAASNPAVDQARAQAAVTSSQADMLDAQTRQFAAHADAQVEQGQLSVEQQRLQHEGWQAQLDRSQDAHLHGQDIAADLQAATLKAYERQAAHGFVNGNIPQPEQPRPALPPPRPSV